MYVVLEYSYYILPPIPTIKLRQGPNPATESPYGKMDLNLKSTSNFHKTYRIAVG